MGLDIDLQNLIEGETICQKIQFLEKKILALEVGIRKIRNNIYLLIEDEDIKEKRASLANDQQISRILHHMEEKTREYKEQIDLMEERFMELFGEEIEI